MKADYDQVLRDYPLYQLKVTLIESNPAIWRRLQVKKETTLLKLHQIVQIVMGWDDAHPMSSGLETSDMVNRLVNRFPTRIMTLSTKAM